MPQRTDTFELVPAGAHLRGRAPPRPARRDRGRSPTEASPTRSRRRPSCPCAWTSPGRPAWAGPCACASRPVSKARACAAWSRAHPEVRGRRARGVPARRRRGALLAPIHQRRRASWRWRDWVRDALALALPGRLQCRPDCAGLCPGMRREPERRPGAPPRRGSRAPAGRSFRGAEVRLADRGGPAGLTGVESPPDSA